MGFAVKPGRYFSFYRSNWSNKLLLKLWFPVDLKRHWWTSRHENVSRSIFSSQRLLLFLTPEPEWQKPQHSSKHNALDFYFILWQFRGFFLFIYFSGVVAGSTKRNKVMSQTGPSERALGLWYRQRETTSSLVQYQTLHRRELVFF